MLAQNIVRINGYKDDKRTHVDIEVEMHTVHINNKTIEVPRIPHFSDIPEIGFSKGLDGVTSYNAYNWIGGYRITEKCM